jgi:catechol 2,3-dioxygenase-like lactoylglutathione lyase family enzyme
VDRPVMTVTSIVLDAPDPGELAAFYRRLLGWNVGREEPGWFTLRAPDGGTGLAFQEESRYVRPVWPAGAGDQQMMAHLDIEVQDLREAGQHAIACGAALADYQPQQNVRVYTDPAGHPFCLWVAE